MPRAIDEHVDFKPVLQERLATAQASLKKLAGALETTKTLASDLIRIRETRLVIDDCKRRLKVA